MTILNELSPDLLKKARVVWSDIYSASVQSLSQDYITYPPDDRLPDASNPTSEETKYILFIFKAEGALEIVFEHIIGKRSTPYSWAIKVINPQFYELKDKLYKLYFKPNKVALNLGGNSADPLQERYDQLLGEVLTGSNLEERYQKELAEIKDQPVSVDLHKNDTIKQQDNPVSVKMAKEAQKPLWQANFRWEKNAFVFGTYGQKDFSSSDRKAMFKKLTDAKGNWVKVAELKGSKKKDYVKSTISQIETSFLQELRQHISIPSTKDDDLEGKPEGQGAYRIKFIL
jgi:hypothetical protein